MVYFSFKSNEPIQYILLEDDYCLSFLFIYRVLYVINMFFIPYSV